MDSQLKGIKIIIIRPNAGAIYGRGRGARILVSVALLGSVIIQMSSLGRAADGQHNYPVYLNCHLAHLASSPLPPSSISQTLFSLSAWNCQNGDSLGKAEEVWSKLIRELLGLQTFGRGEVHQKWSKNTKIVWTCVKGINIWLLVFEVSHNQKQSNSEIKSYSNITKFIKKRKKKGLAGHIK